MKTYIFCYGSKRFQCCANSQTEARAKLSERFNIHPLDLEFFKAI